MTGKPFPYGLGAKIHPSHSAHKTLYAHNPEIIPFVVCKFRRTSWFVNNQRLGFLSTDQDLFVSTYEQDENIVGRTPTEEVDRLEKIEEAVDGAFLGDRFTYGNMDRREVVKEIDESVKRQLTAHDLIEERGIDIPQFPTIMGWEDWHFERCRELIDTLGCSVGFDATQYNSRYELVEHIETLNEVLGPDRIFVNGCISPRWLRMLPESVVACSGSWNIRKETEDYDGNPQRNRLPNAVEKRVDALNNYQTELTTYL